MNFQHAMDIIEATFREECRRQVFQYKDNYSIVAGMGVFAVFLDGEPISVEDMPKRLLNLDKYWGSIIDSYGYYMTTEIIEKD